MYFLDRSTLGDDASMELCVASVMCLVEFVIPSSLSEDVVEGAKRVRAVLAKPEKEDTRNSPGVLLGR